jgi:formate dehydrogenase subunit gamma
MSKPTIIRRADGLVMVERFVISRRAEHLFAIIIFVTLVVTGFPQKLYEASWARWLIATMGGLDTVRTIHRWTGLVFVAHALLHLGVILIGVISRRLRLSLLPTPQDLRDAWNNMAFYFGRRARPPEFGKFDYRQKFEYVGLVLGGMVMVISGLILLYPVAAVGFLPGEAIPAARVAHSSEAMLALLVLVVWHIYGSSLSPEVFPLDPSIFTGYIPAHELSERHPLEYRRLFPDGHTDGEEASAPAAVDEDRSEAVISSAGESGDGGGEVAD